MLGISQIAYIAEGVDPCATSNCFNKSVTHNNKDLLFNTVHYKTIRYSYYYSLSVFSNTLRSNQSSCPLPLKYFVFHGAHHIATSQC